MAAVLVIFCDVIFTCDPASNTLPNGDDGQSPYIRILMHKLIKKNGGGDTLMNSCQHKVFTQ